MRVWAEFNSGLENGRFGGPRPVIDGDKVDLHQAFVDVAVAATSPSAAVTPTMSYSVLTGGGSASLRSRNEYRLRRPNPRRAR